MKTLEFDVMMNDHFVCTMRMPYSPLIILDESEIKAYVESKRPTLKGKNIK